MGLQVAYLSETLAVMQDETAAARAEIESCLLSLPRQSVPQLQPVVELSARRDFPHISCDPADPDSDGAPKWAREVYRRIARATHPDMRSQTADTADELRIRTALFQDASTAAKNKDYAKLLVIAARLGIDVQDDDDTQITALREHVALVESKITEIQTSAENLWLDSQDDRRAEILIAIARMRGSEISYDDALQAAQRVRCKS